MNQLDFGFQNFQQKHPVDNGSVTYELMKILFVDNCSQEIYLSIRCSNPPQGEVTSGTCYFISWSNGLKYGELIGSSSCACLRGRSTVIASSMPGLALRAFMPFNFLYAVIQQSGSSYVCVQL